MRKTVKYSFIVILLIGLFSGVYAKTALLVANTPEPIDVPADSLPRYPVKKTQITEYKDLDANPPADLKDPTNVKTTIEYDPVTKSYIFRTKVGDEDIATPFSLTQEEYMDYTLRKSMSNYFRDKNAEAYNQKDEPSDEGFSLKDIRLNLNVADKLFGPGGVKVTTQGYVEARMGIKRTTSENPTLSERNRKKTTFEFDEDIQMNVTASVGDKINFGMNYDTKALFDFDSKKLKLGYGGKEDEIIKKIEAGNVSMSTTNSLINGGTSLFGINAELQFGKLRVNTVISQQESQSQSTNSKGGIQTLEYELKADQYDENRHFFLGHYFRDNYDKAMSRMPYIQSPVNITRIEVWITNKRMNDYSQARNMLAFAEIAEHDVIKNPLWGSSGSVATPYNGANSLYSTITSSYPAARDITQVTSLFSGYIEGGIDYEKVESARLLSSSEYTYSPQLGYISLTSALQADEVLAVAYEYTMNGKTYQVGEFSTDIVDKYEASNPKSGALLLKLLKPISLSPRSYTWHLMMKNVYRISDNAIQQDRFRLNISYLSDTVGTYLNYITEGQVKNQLLLRVMNLDRLDSRNNEVKNKDGLTGDGIFDFVEGYTVKAQNGRIIFPVVEPFGSHLRKKIGSDAVADKYVYQELYDSTLTIARQIAEKNKFKIYGTYRGSGTNNAEIDLNATNVPQGSVRLTAGGTTLTEGVDYIVDYISGKVTIINQNILDSDIPVQVSSEGFSMGMQRKTMMGLNLSYDISKNFNIGGTIMHYYEKPLTIKTEYGNESVKNTLWGLNTSFRTESMWLTNLVDKLPFVNATQPSQITFNAEFAHMIPGHYQNEEAGGYSYLDDFESSQSRIDIKSPYAWALAATPYDDVSDVFFGGPAYTNKIEYGNKRARLAWFTIDGLFTRQGSSLTPEHIKNDKDQLSNHFVREISMEEIYPYKDVAYNEAATIPALNLSYYPTERGPYNLDATDIGTDGKLLKPEERWGGITRKMDVRDFEASNIEYIEFWLMDPFVYNSTDPVPNKGGELYINLGEISEDVLKDGKKFYENGLPATGDPNDPDAVDFTVWGKVPKRQSTVYAFDDNQGTDARRRQDVGLNGLSTDEEFQFQTYTDYLRDYRAKLSASATEELSNDPFSPLNDPGGDTFHFYRGADYDRNQVSILDRYKHYNNTEGNSRATGDSGESFATAARNTPDVEDIDQDNTLNETEAYFQYKIELDPNKMNVGDNYIVDSRKVAVTLRNGQPGEVTWYQFKVPVRQPDRKIGNIHDFKSIRFMRMYLTKFTQNTFLRFATLQLVRGDWRAYEQTLNKNNTPSGSGTLDVTTVNIEENAERKPIAYVVPPGVSRSTDPGQAQMLKENEQALSLKVTDLDPEDARAVYKTTAYDLRRYKRLQMFVHAEKLIDGEDLAKGDLTVFMRLGSDYKNNYYEYEIPLTITPEGTYNTNSQVDRYAVWPTDNMFDYPLELLKNVKLHRNREKRKAGSAISYTTLYSEYDPDKKNNKVSVMGNPSLSEINVIMIGVRNNTRVVKSGEVWINELRLTDFDEKGGWAAQGNLNVALSDLGTISVSGRKETVGFGALDQSLMERRSDDYYTYSVAANVELGKFFPEKAKVSLPLYYSYSNQTTTPEYDPFDQDVTLKESLSLVDTKAEKDSIKSLARDRTTTRSISLNNVKVNVQSKTPMPYDPANFTMSYSYSRSETNNPTTVYDLTKNYKATLNYSYSPLVKTWEPFKKVKGKSGAAKFAKSIGFNYLPASIDFNSNITRYYTETSLRDIESYTLGGDNSAYQFLSWSQSFLWDRDFNINWDFTRNIKFSFQSGTRAEIEEPYLQVNKELNRSDYEIWKDEVTRSLKSLGDPLSYRQVVKLTYQLPFRNIPALNWINSNAAYTSGYQWDRGAKIDSMEVGNTISNNMTLEFTNRLNLTTLYNKSSFLKRVNDRFDGRNKRTQSPAQRNNQQARRRRFTQQVTLKSDGKTEIRHGLSTKNLEVVAKKDGKTYTVKFKKVDENTIRITNKDSVRIQLTILSKPDNLEGSKIWKEIAEYSARALMSVRTLSFNYSRRDETHISGFKPGIGDAFGQKGSDHGLVPGLGFAFGLDGGEDFINKSQERDWLVMNDVNLSPAIFSNAEKFEMRAQVEPFKNFRIELKANYEKNKRTEVQYMFDGSPKSLGGNFSMTTVALSSALRSSNAKDNYYSEAFNKFLQNRHVVKERLETMYQNTSYPSGGFLAETNPNLQGQSYSPSNGEVDLNSADVLIPAFISAYTGKDAGKISLSAFPSLLSILPNWTLTYDGLTSLSLLKDKFKSIRITHGYTCFYQVSNYNSFSNWMDAGDGLGYIRDVLNGNPVPSSPYNISSVGISEIFNPLFGVEGTLNNSMSINARYNNARTLSLNMTSYQIIESLQRELVVGLGYRINEFNRLIGLKSGTDSKFNNDLNIKADLSHKTTEALLRKIQENFTQATNGTTIVTLKISADYTISRALTLRAFYDRILNKPLISLSAYPTTNTNFGISLRFTLVQ
ncbi:cell surface protein SprA [Dysgonomonas sp. 511]|uniref:T9SS outer membrane translocon Sov/SprA n=1 Tax=Dysgonomonas sp. 511 TaxID=2302930 RepID=UPI0013D3D21C|nr:cell surface protein SprA [Dysgonomonas sp. 511]NDV77439.1 cell surface protein SprA [Dysgonomonas sp. 511]